MQLHKAGFLGIFAATIAAAGLVACAEKGAKHRPGVDPAPEVRAGENINDSFLVDNVAAGENRARIAIRKSALDKEFLLQSAATIMPFLGTTNGNKTRVVAFKKVENKLFMLEATQGHVVTDDVPQAFILASFPITGEGRDAYYFDFNAGMSRLFVAQEWRASDFEGAQPSQDPVAAKISNSFLAQATSTANNEVILRQVAQLDMPSPNGLSDTTTVEAKYYLTPYKPDPEFKSVETTDFNWMGFFEVAARYDDKGVAVVNASKWNDKKPIVFSVSANTPADYKQAVKDGIKYWNKALGVTTIDAIDAPEGVSAPDFNHNIVQWVEWDEAGFAYADAQADPRTGEILHAQVFMTSVFAVSGLKSAKKLIDSLKPQSGTQQKANNLNRTSIALKGLVSKPLCNRDTLVGLADALEAAIEDGADDAKILKISQDYVREVIAHEVGHTLGLRHNFAGSLAMNFTAAEMTAKLKEYVDAGETPANVVPSSSVMEYQAFIPSILTGDIIRRAGEPLAYDLRAIQALYNPGVPATGPAPLFCTDSHTMGQFSDCERFDVGGSALESAVYDLSVTSKMLTDVINDGTMDIPLVLLLPADFVAARVLRDRPALVLSLTSGKQLIRKRRPLEQAWPPVASEDIAVVEKAFLNSEIDRMGGIEKLLPTVTLPAAPSPEFETAAKNLRIAFTKAEVDALTLSKDTTFVDGEAGDKVLTAINAKATEVVSATTGEPSDVDGIKLPNFTYPLTLRVAAAKLLAASQGSSLEWGLAERTALRAKVAGFVTTAFGQDSDNLDAATLKRPAARWILEQRQIISALQ